MRDRVHMLLGHLLKWETRIVYREIRGTSRTRSDYQGFTVFAKSMMGNVKFTSIAFLIMSHEKM